MANMLAKLEIAKFPPNMLILQRLTPSTAKQIGETKSTYVSGSSFLPAFESIKVWTTIFMHSHTRLVACRKKPKNEK